MSEDLCYMSATDLAAAIRTRRVSPREVADAVLAQIDRINPMVNAFVTVVADQARAAARDAEALVMRSPEKLGLLHGIPVSFKDVTPTKDIRTTFGSRAFADHVPAEDAIVVERMKQAGAIILGKTNTPEFAAGGNTKNALFGPTRNPWRLSHTCGGSSGGAAVALATGMGPLAQGSDLGGSLRIPASFCGVIGFRTTPGVVPSYPSAMAWDTFSVTGPMARTVEDTALMLTAIAGPDERAPISVPVNAAEWLQAVQHPDVRGWRVAWSPDLGVSPTDANVTRVAKAAAQTYRALGCTVEDDQPDFTGMREIIPPYRATMMAAVYGDLLPKWRDQMFPPLVRNIELGFTITATQWAKAEMERTKLWHRVRTFFEQYDLLLTPTVAVPPFPLEWDYPSEINGKPMDTYLDWILLTYAITLTGLPAISIPAGWTEDGFPVGLQIVGRRFGESRVLRAAAALEAARPWADKRPPLV